VMRGAQLTVNLETGQATLGGGAKAPGTPPGAGGRVQGIFTPPAASGPNPPPGSN
jgi:lipopolysaccharide export system protein LptA